MNIIKNEFEVFDDSLLICSNCRISISQQIQKSLYSQICNHRLCDSCNTKLFLSKVSALELCKICNKTHEGKDYKYKHREEIYYDTDSGNRAKAFSA
jgi:hypothetical protein